MGTAYVEMTEDNGMVYVSGPYHLMANTVNPKLKSQGFRWDGVNRRWELPAAKITPIKRKNLLKIIEPLTQTGAASSGTDLRSPKQKILDELVRRKRDGLCTHPPFELKDKASVLGGIWDDVGRVWCMPDEKSLKEMKDAINATPKMVALREIARRKTERLGVNIPYEYKDEAKSLGGLWDDPTHMWYLPDDAAKKKVLDKIEKDRESARDVAQRHLEQERDKTEKERARLGLKTYYFPGDHRGDHPAVGHTFKDRKTGDFMEVVSVKSTYYEEDGMSFGLMDDRGWLHVVTARPSQDDTAVQAIKDEETKALTRSQAFKRRDAIAKEIRTRGTMPSGDHDFRQYPRVVLEDERLIAYGGGSWFVITPTDIWFIQNNGGDGDSWGDNNVTTGGAGAMGWKVPGDDILEKELRDLDALIGGKW